MSTWTIDDLPDRYDLVRVKSGIVQPFFFDAVLDAVIEHLNAHYPKRDFSGVDWRAMYEQASREREQAEHERDEARVKLARWKNRTFEHQEDAAAAERERDDAIARAEQAENAHHPRPGIVPGFTEKGTAAIRETLDRLVGERDEWRHVAAEQTRLERDRAEKAEAERDEAVRRVDDVLRRATHAEGNLLSMTSGRDEWRERAETAEQKYGAERLRYEKIRDHHADESRKWGEKRRGYEDQIAQMESDQTGPAVPAVSRADVEQALRAADSDTSHGDEVTYADLAAVVCRLFGIDQPDPVEAKALEFAALADFELTGREAELLHKVAAHVMEADDE